MILSHHRKFLFLKGRKVGGTSAEVVLAQLCDDRDIVSLITPIDERVRLLPPYGRGAQNFTSDWESEEIFLRQTLKTPIDALDSIKIPEREYYAHILLTELEALQGFDSRRL